MKKLKQIKKVINSIARFYAHYNYVDQLRDSCGTLEVTFKYPINFEQQNELRGEIAKRLNIDPAKIVFVAAA